jgi:hypothetical protein
MRELKPMSRSRYMNRRNFISLATTAAGILLLPELLIPKRTFFLPPVGGWQKYDYVEIALGYTVTYGDIADNLYQIERPGISTYSINTDEFSIPTSPIAFSRRHLLLAGINSDD